MMARLAEVLQSCTPNKSPYTEPAFLLCEYANIGVPQRLHLLDVRVSNPWLSSKNLYRMPCRTFLGVL